MIRVALLMPVLALIAGIVGCGGPTPDEDRAARALAPKPTTEAQRRAVEEVKAKFPGAGFSPHAGAGR